MSKLFYRVIPQIVSGGLGTLSARDKSVLLLVLGRGRGGGRSGKRSKLFSLRTLLKRIGERRRKKGTAPVVSKERGKMEERGKDDSSDK